MSKKSKFTRLGAAVFILVSLALFQGSDPVSEDGCAGCVDDALKTKYGTVRIVNLTGHSRIYILIIVTNCRDKYDNPERTAEYTGGMFETLEMKSLEGPCFYIWRAYAYGNFVIGEELARSAGHCDVPAGRSRTIKIK